MGVSIKNLKIMSVIENKNYTNFQNVNLKGTDSHPGALRLTAVGGDGKTISFVQGSGEAQYLTVAEGLRLGSGYISLQSRNTEGTLAAGASLEAARAWKLPNKSGTFPIMGTFAVQIPAGVAAFFSTAVTVSGIRLEDAIITQFSTPASVGYDFDNSTAYVLIGNRPENGQITLFFNNPGNATAYIEQVVAYVAMR